MKITHKDLEKGAIKKIALGVVQLIAHEAYLQQEINNLTFSEKKSASDINRELKKLNERLNTAKHNRKELEEILYSN